MILGWGRSRGEGNGNPLQYSCLENSMDRGAWWATDHGVTELDMTERLTLNTVAQAKNSKTVWVWTHGERSRRLAFWNGAHVGRESE